MPIKKYKPTTPGRRWMSVNTFSEITTDKPFKKLTTSLSKTAGRSSSGRISVRHRGGWHKRRFRHIDFHRTHKIDVPATVETIEYDPNRSAFIALVKYNDNERRYVLAYQWVEVGDTFVTSANAKPIAGNRIQVGNVPTWLQVFNVELILGQGATTIRSAGASATIVSQDGDYSQVKFPSGEVRLLHKECFVTVGEVSNGDHNQIKIGKAGRNRWKGKRPTVGGTNMNPVDHPHGWGEWHGSLWRQPTTPWGKPALGVKTRKNKTTNRWIAIDKRGNIIAK